MLEGLRDIVLHRTTGNIHLLGDRGNGHVLDPAQLEGGLASLRQLGDAVVYNTQYVREIGQLFIRVVDAVSEFQEMISIVAPDNVVTDVIKDLMLDDTIQVRPELGHVLQRLAPGPQPDKRLLDNFFTILPPGDLVGHIAEQECSIPAINLFKCTTVTSVQEVHQLVVGQ